MSISSRTPEGNPDQCPLCASHVTVEPSLFFGDATCPHCGTLLWFMQAADQVRFVERDRAEELREKIHDLVMDKLGIEERVLMIVADNLGIDREDVLARLHEHSGALGPPSAWRNASRRSACSSRSAIQSIRLSSG